MDNLPNEIKQWYANADPKDVQRALELGFNMVSYKPNLTKVGNLGEEYITKMFQSCGCNIDDSHKKTASGDLVLITPSQKRICVEIKTYRSPIPKTEIDKFHRDIEVNGFAAGIFISLYVKAKREFHSFQLDTLCIGKKTVPIIYLSEITTPEIIESAYRTLDHIINNMDLTKQVRCINRLMSVKENLSRTRTELLNSALTINRQIMKCTSDIYNIENDIESIYEKYDDTGEIPTYMQAFITANKDNIVKDESKTNNMIEFKNMTCVFLKTKTNISVPFNIDVLTKLQAFTDLEIKVLNDKIHFGVNKSNIALLDNILTQN